MAQISLLGGVSAVTDDGHPADVGPAKSQAVLAALALSAGNAVPVWRLTELVWGADPPRTAERTLQSYVTRLRKGLGADSIVRVGAAYRLDVAADAVDVVRFRRCLDAGDVEAALAEWTGLPLAGLDVPGLAAAVDGLVEQWLAAVETELARRVEAEASTAVGQLTELTATYPFREGLWALLMTALYRVGRQTDALAAYRTARQGLVAHLGVEPGPRLRELESLVLGHDDRLAVGLANEPALSRQTETRQTETRKAEPRQADSRQTATRPTGTVTFGFSEIADAGRWWSTHRQETAAATRRHEAVVRALVDRHDGYVFATGGESFGVAFRRAATAACWATELQATMRGRPRDAAESDAVESDAAESDAAEIRVRIGLHTGETDEREQGYFGPAVHVAARLAAAGNGGQTLVSGATAALLGRAGLRDLGTYRLDGLVAEQRVFQVGDDEHPPLRSEDSRRGNLPRRLGRLVGRDELLDVVGDALAAVPVVTLVGPGGIGKTRLAVAVAAAARHADLADGVWLVELAEISAPDDVPRAVAGVLGVKESTGKALSESVVAALSSRRALLVLDNCEHVVDGATRLAQAVADRCPGVQVLATSREGLGLAYGHERLVAVPPLEPTGPGAELFVERALAVSAGFDPEASRSDVEEICRRLDGVPLAIELAAARIGSLAPSDLLARLDDQLRLLVGGQRTSAERHRTLRATVRWSYDLLSPAEQRLFQKLSIFMAPFDATAAGAVATTTAGREAVEEVDDLLGNLVTRSMLVVEPGPFGRRFRLLETMRQFAAERLAESGETGLVAERHARWCLGAARRIQRLLAGPQEVEGVARLDELWPNLRAAFDWACTTGDRAVAFGLLRAVVVEVVRRSRNEIGDWIERVLALEPPSEELVVFGLTWAAERYKLRQDVKGYERLAERYGEPDHPLVHHARAAVSEDYQAHATWAGAAVAELRRNGDDDLAEQFELDVAAALLFRGQFPDHDRLAAGLADRYRTHGPPTLLNLTLVMLGYSAMLQGAHDRADRLFSDAGNVEVPRRTHSPNKAVQAGATFRRGDRTRAYRILRGHVDELLDDDNMQAACVTTVEFINMTAAVDRVPDAARMLGFLETTGLLDAPAWRTLLAEAETTITAYDRRHQTHEQASGRNFDDRQALEYMRDVLDQLAQRQPG